MNRREMSLYKLLALVALSGALPGVLGACQKEGTITPFSEQTDKAPAQPGKNTGDTSNNTQPQNDQSGGDASQKSQ